MCVRAGLVPIVWGGSPAAGGCGGGGEWAKAGGPAPAVAAPAGGGSSGTAGGLFSSGFTSPFWAAAGNPAGAAAAAAAAPNGVVMPVWTMCWKQKIQIIIFESCQFWMGMLKPSLQRDVSMVRSLIEPQICCLISSKAYVHQVKSWHCTTIPNATCTNLFGIDQNTNSRRRINCSSESDVRSHFNRFDMFQLNCFVMHNKSGVLYR